MTNCVIVDDEPLARQLIESYLEQIPDMQCLGCYQDAISAFSALHQHKVDVIFIDIQMPGINGLNFIKSIKSPPKVVFITAYTEYAVDAFEVEAIDYLVKPVTFERFLKTIQKIGTIKTTEISNIQPDHEITDIFLKVDRRLVKISLTSIIYIEALGDHLKVHIIGEKTYLIYQTLTKILALLPEKQFIRIHRSTIINKSFIQFLEGNYVSVNNIDLAIGFTYKDNLLRSLGEK